MENANAQNVDQTTSVSSSSNTQVIESLTNKPNPTASDYFNLSSAYFNQGQPHFALAYAKIAKHLIEKYPPPLGQNENLQALNENLVLIQSDANQRGLVQENRDFWYGKFVPVAKSIPAPVLFFSSAGIEILLAVLFLWQVLKVRKRLWFKQPKALTVLGIWIVFTASSALTWNAKSALEAVVIVEKAQAHSGPGESFSQTFSLIAGTTVAIDEDADAVRKDEAGFPWRRIRFSLGKEGWIMEKQIKALE